MDKNKSHDLNLCFSVFHKGKVFSPHGKLQVKLNGNCMQMRVVLKNRINNRLIRSKWTEAILTNGQASFDLALPLPYSDAAQVMSLCLLMPEARQANIHVVADAQDDRIVVTLSGDVKVPDEALYFELAQAEGAYS